MTEAALPPPPPAAAPVPPEAPTAPAPTTPAPPAPAQGPVRTAPGRGWLTGLDQATRRQTFIVAAILAGFFFGSQLLNEVLPTRAEDQVRPGTPVAIGEKASIVPLAGWELSRFEDGSGIRLEKGTVVLDLFAETSANAGDLAAAYLEQVLRPQATELTASDTETATSGSGTAARFTYQGMFSAADGAIEGEVTAIVAGGQGVVADAWAPQGRLTSLLDEIHQLIETIEVRA